MADQIEKVTEQQTQDQSGRVVTTRAVTADSRDRQVNKVSQIIWFIFGIAIALLLVRFTLSLIGANQENAFASFVYSVTNVLVGPFRGLLSVDEFRAGVSRFEFETLVAVVVYTLLGWGVAAGINLARKNPEV